ncbi:hypothetical protein RFI_26248 [Reticulomyxa filosa]|uniref:Uncharacterized protein n=1 Tax=Reticulomyxa filosa TaxID=46433 RepID=X6MAT8_RETFI|nr:hypothetical protein RFI_26248 [Reticulomyxa filosa]|eukprot:ETO11128.1 hypothetical protein RFI_26248 [Reticulomyxa filosa]
MVEFIDKNHKKLIGIGEVGLDYSPHVIGKQVKTDSQNDEVAKKRNELTETQKKFLRGAGHYTLEFLMEHNDHKKSSVLMHAFDGKPSYALKCVSSNNNFYFSIPPSIVRSPEMTKLVSLLPKKFICLESDSPALAKQKGERNEPAEIVHSLNKIAQIHQTSVQEIAEITTCNAKNLFLGTHKDTTTATIITDVL